MSFSLLFLLFLPFFTFASVADVWLRVFENQKVVKGEYGQRAWLFENTAALVGYLSEGWKTFGWEDYARNLRRMRPSEEDLSRALALGIVSGFSQGFLVEPDARLSAKRGRPLAPEVAYRVGLQQLRQSLLQERRERVEGLYEEWFTLYGYLQGLCRSQWQASIVPSGPISAPCGPCVIRRRPPVVCETCLLANASGSAKEAILKALSVLERQSTGKREALCAVALVWLEKSRSGLSGLESNLYRLSTLYSF